MSWIVGVVILFVVVLVACTILGIALLNMFGGKNESVQDSDRKR